jgi:signal transduction histidine kinase
VSLLGVGVGCVIFVLSLPLASGLVHRIFLPIRQLVAATNRIANGDYEAHVDTNRPDEIGMLARSFNEMVLKIREHQKQLRVANEQLAEANKGLEEKVKQRTRELEHTNARLSSEIAEKEDFLRAVSHDLNAPLRNISGMAAMLLIKYRERFDEDIIHRLERIRKNVELETDLIAELLELSRIKTRRQRMEQVDVGSIIGDLRDVFENDLRQKQIALIVESGLPTIMCEKARIRQVFQNLIDNSIKYMGEGASREIEISHRINEDGIEFQVRDTGIGIDPEDLPKVFYVFRRGKNTAEVKGKGVGLASVKSIIETYDGRIWVASELGQGSTFRFTIAKRFVPALGGNGKPGGEVEGDELAKDIAA